MAGSTSGFLDLKKQFVFYASYHNHPVNVLIHLGCIWNLSIEKYHEKHTVVKSILIFVAVAPQPPRGT